jgi:hypothetical protein
MRAIVGLLMLAAVVLGGCGPATHDPTFETVELAEAPAEECDASMSCVEVQGTVAGSRSGEGSCAVYPPGDPASLEPLARSDMLVMQPGETVRWVAQVPEDTDVAGLNPVCEPMVEG